MNEAEKKEMNSLKWSAILEAALYVILGLAAIFATDAAMVLVAQIIGWSMILAGAVMIVIYLIRDAAKNYYRNDFLHGMIFIVLGIVVLKQPAIVINFFPTILGALVVISGCIKLQNAIDLKRWNDSKWIGMLVTSVVNIILGGILIVKATTVATVMFVVLGIVLIICGVTDIIITFAMFRKIRNMTEVVNAVATEVPLEAESQEENK